MNKRLTILIVFLVGFVALCLYGCSNDSSRKIRLAVKGEENQADVQTSSSVLQIPPTEKRNLVILYFDNETGDPSLDWLRRGLSDMLFTELSQASYVNVIPMQRLMEIAQDLGKKNLDLFDSNVAEKIAQKAKAEMILSGQFFRVADSLFIEAELHNMVTNRVVRREIVSGTGLEQVFLMVAKLSDHLRSNLRGDLEDLKNPEIKLIDMTQSLEAFRYYSQGMASLDKLLYAQAENFFTKAVELDSTFAEAYMQLANCGFHFKNTKDAESAMKKAQKYKYKLSESSRISLKLMQASSTANITEILQLLKESLKYAPYDVENRKRRAAILMGLQQYDKAIEEYEYILELDPNQNLVYNQLGYIYANRGDFTTALKYLDEYQERAPNEPNPYDSKGEILMMAGELPQAAVQLKKALAKYSKFQFSCMRLSNIYSELGDLDQALKYSDQWIENASSPAEEIQAYLNRAKLLVRFGEFQQAMEAIDIAREKGDQYISPILLAGEFYEAKGDSAAAQKLYRSFFDKNIKNIQLDDKNINEIFAFLTFCLETNMPPKEILPILNKIYNHKKIDDFNKSRLRLIMGLLYLQSNDFQNVNMYLDSLDKKLIQSLTEIPHVGRWSGGWKYFIEAYKLLPKQGTVKYKFCNEIIDSARKSNRVDIEANARFLKTVSYANSDLQDHVRKEYQIVGSPLESDWWVIGPFANQSGFDQNYPPEFGIDLDNVYHTDGAEIKWQPAVDVAMDGYVNLRNILKKSTWSVGYGLVYIKSPEKRVVKIRLGTDEACKLWLNDDLIWKAYRLTDSGIDNDEVTVCLRAGYNKLLIKVTNSVYDWGYYLRVTDDDGYGFSDIEFYSPDKMKTSLLSSTE